MERQITEEQFEKVRIHMRDTYDVAEHEWDEEELIEAIYELLVSKNESLHLVSNRDTICKKCQKKMIIDMMNDQVYCDDCGDWAGGKCDNLDCKHK
jgi:hypothetical protein